MSTVYKIPVVSLRISPIGFRPVTVQAPAGGPPLQAVLEETTVKLDELVVTFWSSRPARPAGTRWAGRPTCP